MKSLEDRIAYLETQLISHGIPDVERTYPGFSPEGTVLSTAPFTAHEEAPPREVPQDFVQQIALGSLESESLVTRDGLSLLSSLLAGPVSRTLRSEGRSDHHSLLNELPYETRASMPPKEAATRLVNTYFEHCDFFSPILPSKEGFLAMIQPLYDSSGTVDDALVKAKFRALIIFGIAVLLLNRSDPSVPISRSEGYFAAAMRTLSQHAHLICTTDLDHAINLLLIIQHCCFCANLTAAWHFIGLTTRLVLELGLHDERGAVSCLGLEELNTRRWLFWSTYVFERNLCVIIGRPFSIPDEAIRTLLPTVADDEPRRLLALHLIKCRRLESEMHTTLNYSRPMNGALLNTRAWREDMHNRLLQWRESVPSLEHTSQFAPPDIFNGYFANAVVLLYYPSSLLPSTTQKDIQILAEHARSSIEAYKTAFRAGRLRFYWRTVHNLFRSGMAVVYCIHVASLHPGLDLGPHDMHALLHSCSSIIWGMVERYPAGKAYRDIFEQVISSAPSREQVAGQRSIFDLVSMDVENMDMSSFAMDSLSWNFGTNLEDM